MEKLEFLSGKLKKLVSEYKQMREENLKMQAEIQFLKKEVLNHKDRLNENITLKKDKKEAVLRIERILKKIDTLKAD